MKEQPLSNINAENVQKRPVCSFTSIDLTAVTCVTVCVWVCSFMCSRDAGVWLMAVWSGGTGPWCAWRSFTALAQISLIHPLLTLNAVQPTSALLRSTFNTLPNDTISVAVISIITTAGYCYRLESNLASQCESLVVVMKITAAHLILEDKRVFWKRPLPLHDIFMTDMLIYLLLVFL